MMFPSAAWDQCKSNILQVDLEDQEQELELHHTSCPVPGLGKCSQAGLILLLQDGRALHTMASPC